MRENPSGRELLDIAREVLKKDLIPALPKEQRYSALMIANAMAIVMRQIEADVRKKSNRSGLQENRELAHQIRSGQADGEKIWAALVKTALTTVSESNPKYL